MTGTTQSNIPESEGIGFASDTAAAAAATAAADACAAAAADV